MIGTLADLLIISGFFAVAFGVVSILLSTGEMP